MWTGVYLPTFLVPAAGAITHILEPDEVAFPVTVRRIVGNIYMNNISDASSVVWGLLILKHAVDDAGSYVDEVSPLDTDHDDIAASQVLYKRTGSFVKTGLVGDAPSWRWFDIDTRVMRKFEDPKHRLSVIVMVSAADRLQHSINLRVLVQRAGG